MAWPFTPLTTYIANSLPVIKSFDLNSIQSVINGLIGGTKSVKQILLDGVGNLSNSDTAPLAVAQSVLADTALAHFKDQVGHVRTTVDHLGYISGQNVIEAENWFAPAGSNVTSPTASFPGTTTRSSTNPKWQYTLANSGTTGAAISGASATAFSLYSNIWAKLAPGADATRDQVELFSDPVILVQSFSSVVFEFLVATTLANNRIAVGLSVAPNTTGVSGSTEGAYFYSSGSGAWQCISSDGSAAATTTTGSSPAANTVQRMRIEIHGSASPYGACNRFFINGTLVATSTTHLPGASALRMYFRADGNSTSPTLVYVSAIRLWQNIYATSADA